MSGIEIQLQNTMAMQQGRNVPTAKQLAPGGDMDAMREAAQEFEALFIAEMIRPMFEGIKTEAPFGGGQSEKMWRSLQIDEYGKAVANAGGVGIADNVLNEMIRLQEANQP